MYIYIITHTHTHVLCPHIHTHFLHIQGGIGKGLFRMSDAMIQHIFTKTAPLLYMLGYELVSLEPEPIGGNLHHADNNSNGSSNSTYSSSNNGNSNCSGYSIKLNSLTINEHIQNSINNHHNSHTNITTTTTSNNACTSNEGVYINTPYSIRRSDDPFGRDFTLTRRRLTEDDRRPLPTMTP